jgi:hypothetical protein
VNRTPFLFPMRSLDSLPADPLPSTHLGFIRRWILLFMVALVLSGITAVPLAQLTALLATLTVPLGGALAAWSGTVAVAVADVASRHPFLFYGTDWLAFAHLVIALLFIGAYRDPVRNKWIIQWGLWSCALVVLVSFAWAPVRGIPFFWRCVDASFGVIGALPLLLVLRRIRAMENAAYAA